jgi:hypothetical protein
MSFVLTLCAKLRYERVYVFLMSWTKNVWKCTELAIVIVFFLATLNENGNFTYSQADEK